MPMDWTSPVPIAGGLAEALSIFIYQNDHGSYLDRGFPKKAVFDWESMEEVEQATMVWWWYIVKKDFAECLALNEQYKKEAEEAGTEQMKFAGWIPQHSHFGDKIHDRIMEEFYKFKGMKEGEEKEAFKAELEAVEQELISLKGFAAIASR